MATQASSANCVKTSSIKLRNSPEGEKRLGEKLVGERVLVQVIYYS